jgi:hypothetical protein
MFQMCASHLKWRITLALALPSSPHRARFSDGGSSSRAAPPADFGRGHFGQRHVQRTSRRDVTMVFVKTLSGTEMELKSVHKFTTMCQQVPWIIIRVMNTDDSDDDQTMATGHTSLVVAALLA